VLSYAPVGGDGAACPECGVPYPRAPDQAAQTDVRHRRLRALVRMTRDLLDLDIALLSEIRDGRETALMVAGDWWPGGHLDGVSIPLEESFCRLMLEGRIGNAVPDARREAAVAALPMVEQLGVRAYMGVPIRLSDTELYVLCCLAREARPSLGPREVKLLSGLAASVRAELESSEPATVVRRGETPAAARSGRSRSFAQPGSSAP
jgi:GAF domain-containing protein